MINNPLHFELQYFLQVEEEQEDDDDTDDEIDDAKDNLTNNPSKQIPGEDNQISTPDKNKLIEN